MLDMLSCAEQYKCKNNNNNSNNKTIQKKTTKKPKNTHMHNDHLAQEQNRCTDGAGIAQLVVLGLAVHSIAGSILLWGHFR